MQIDFKSTLVLMLSMCALMTVGNGRCIHRDLTSRRCNHLATKFNCYSPSNVKCLRTVDTIQSTHVLSGMNENMTFFNHRVEINFDSKKTGSKKSYYQFLEDGPEGNVNFIFDINKKGVATQLFQGSPSWTPFAYAYINRVHIFMQCHGDQLQYTDIVLGVERFGRPRRSDYRRAEEVLTCLGVPQEVQDSIIVPGLTTFAAIQARAARDVKGQFLMGPPIAAASQSDSSTAESKSGATTDEIEVTTAEIEVSGTTAGIEVTIDEDEVITDEAHTSPPETERPTTPSEADTTKAQAGNSTTESEVTTAAANETEVTTAATPPNQTDVTTAATTANQSDVTTAAAPANQTDVTTTANDVTTAANEVKLTTAVANGSDVTTPAKGNNFPNWIP